MNPLTFFTQSTAHLLALPALFCAVVLCVYLRNLAKVGKELDDEKDGY